MLQQLGAALKKVLAANGPAGAVSVCRDLAPSIGGELSRKSGSRVARISLKTRNPLTGAPDVWEQQVLAEFDREAAAGEQIESLEFSESVDEPRGHYFGEGVAHADEAIPGAPHVFILPRNSGKYPR